MFSKLATRQRFIEPRQTNGMPPGGIIGRKIRKYEKTFRDEVSAQNAGRVCNLENKTFKFLQAAT